MLGNETPGRIVTNLWTGPRRNHLCQLLRLSLVGFKRGGGQILGFSIDLHKNLAIANRSRVSCAHNTLSASIGLNITPYVTLKSRLKVTQGHWKRNHWINHTQLTIGRVIWRWILSWPWNVVPWSLKVVPFESLDTVSYSPSIVTMAVSLAISEIFSLKEWPDLEIWVLGRSRWLKMARFDRTCMTFY